MVRLLFNPRFPLILLAVFLIYAGLWAIRPVDFKDWALENALTALLLMGLIATYRRFPLSNISYLLIFLFLCLHTIGSHYTYSLVPYDRWAKAVSGWTINEMLGWERNNFDRVVHFLFGLLMSYPIREIFMRVARARGFWSYYLPLDLTMSFSMLYEVIEWAAAVGFGGDLGIAYVGAQGDPWDAQKDMALATLGALITMLIVGWINWMFDKEFGNEWRQSLDATGQPPLGERKLAQILRGN
jgi:putative membrane protein